MVSLCQFILLCLAESCIKIGFYSCLKKDLFFLHHSTFKCNIKAQFRTGINVIWSLDYFYDTSINYYSIIQTLKYKTKWIRIRISKTINFLFHFISADINKCHNFQNRCALNQFISIEKLIKNILAIDQKYFSNGSKIFEQLFVFSQLIRNRI